MSNELREIIAIVGPISAVIVALMTTLFNLYDRRRHYRIESEKLVSQQMMTVLESSEFLKDKYIAYKLLLAELAQLKNLLRRLELVHIKTPVPSAEETAPFQTELTRHAQGALELLAQNSLVIPEDVHAASRDGIMNVMRLAETLGAERPVAPDDLRSAIARLDTLKNTIQQNFSKTLS